MSPRRGFGFSAWLLAAGCASLLAACAGASDPRSSAGSSPSPNILLIVVDTLGVEHVGAYGSPWAEGASPTPHLDALSQRGVLFEHAYSPAPWTQPAIASLLTGRLPSSHGLVRLFGTLEDDLPWVPERLAEAGYETAGVVSHKLVGSRYGFDRGFSTWDESAAGGARPVTSARVTHSALTWLARRNPAGSRAGSVDEPFFLYIHYFDPHYVYRHHPEHDRTRGYSGPLSPGMPIWTLRGLRSGLTPGDVAYLRGLYREEIAYTDAQIGRLLGGLDSLGLAEETAVVITADHGEELMRHGWIGHTRTLYDELLRVPLVIVPAGGAARGGQRVEEPVSLVDLAPTLLALAGAADSGFAETEPLGHAAVSLAPLLSGDGAATRERLAERKLLAEVSFATDGDKSQAEKAAYLVAAFDSRYKAVRDLAAESWSLFDRAADPDELTPVPTDGEVDSAIEELMREVSRFDAARQRRGRASDLVVPETEELERLRALGYLR